ncbi:unnamed protein product [Linum trigynum]|uniref:Uncharacterized protein n=1 Tax=Linum trigynum TaxID=586398 RepID=A0AAV2FBI6_9ROSI
MLKIELRFNFQELCDICADRVCTNGQTRLGKFSYRYPDVSAGGVVYQEVVINDDDAVTMMLQFLSDNGMRLAEVYVETEAVAETHSHRYSYDDDFAGGYRWGGSSSNYEGGGYTGGYGEGGSSRIDRVGATPRCASRSMASCTTTSRDPRGVSNNTARLLHVDMSPM